MGKMNQERPAEYLGELQHKEDTNDCYVGALRGETLTRKQEPKCENTTNPKTKRH